MFPMSPKSLQKSSEWTSNEAIGPLTRVDVGKAIQLLSRSWCVHKKKGLRMAEIRIWSLTKKKKDLYTTAIFLAIEALRGRHSFEPLEFWGTWVFSTNRREMNKSSIGGFKYPEIWSSMGMIIIPHIRKKNSCLKPPTGTRFTIIYSI